MGSNYSNSIDYIKRKMYLFLLLALTSFGVLRAATWTSAATGQWNVGSTWTLVGGSPAQPYPTSADLVTIGGTHTVTVAGSSYCTSLSVGATAGIFVNAGQSLVVYGTFTNSGNLRTGGSATLYFSTSGSIPNPVVTQTGTMSGNFTLRIWPNGATRSVTLATGSSFTVTQVIADLGPGTVTNNATINCSNFFRVNNNVNFVNGINGTLNLNVNVSVGTGSFIANGSPNFVRYSGTTWNSVYPTTYHNLVVVNTGGPTMAVKTLGGNVIINNDFTIASNVQLDCNNRDMTIGGTWINNNSTNNLLNTGGTFTFGGASPSVRRWSIAEVFGAVAVNCTGSFTPNSTLTAGYTGNFSCTSLALTGGTLDLNAGANYTVSVTGNMSATAGTLNGRNGLINFIGSAAQTISGSAITFSNIRVANAAGVSTSSAHSMTGTLTVASGSFTSATADFTLISDATTGTTARVAALTSGSVAGSRWIVQRRILTGAPSSNAPYWADFSSPINGNTLSDWDSEMYMSGVGGADGTACCPTFYSVQQWNNGGANYSNVTSLIALAQGYGYSIWTADNLNTLNPFTFDSRGTLNSGAIVKGGLAATYYLMGNPYPSQILFSSIGRTNVGNYFWILDETLQDYAYWDGTVGTGKLAGSGGVINSSQGFMVECTSAGGSVSFAETNKTTSTTTFVKEAFPVNMVKFHFTREGGRQVGMESMIHFVENASNGKDELDIPFLPAPFLRNRYEVKMLTLTGNELSKNTLNLLDNKHEIPVVFKPSEVGNYTLNFDGLKDQSGYSCAVLEDLTTGTFTELSDERKSYNFDCSEVLERHFVLHFARSRENMACIERSKAFTTIEENTQIANQVLMNQNGIAVQLTNQDVKTIEVAVYNAVGQLVSAEKYVGGGEFTAKRPAVAGIYFVILSRDGKTETHKVVLD